MTRAEFTNDHETHHPDISALWDYHRGATTHGQSIVLEAHVSGCQACLESLSLFDQVGGALLQTAPIAQLSAEALELAMARIERPEAPLPMASSPSLTTNADIKALMASYDCPLEPHVAQSLQNIRLGRRYWAAPGVWILPVQCEDDPTASRTYFMHVKAGMTMPSHSHCGRELTLILKGQYCDGDKTYQRGDIAEVLDDETHAPHISSGEDCLCLIYQDAPIRPKTMLGHLLKPFARI